MSKGLKQNSSTKIDINNIYYRRKRGNKPNVFIEYVKNKYLGIIKKSCFYLNKKINKVTRKQNFKYTYISIFIYVRLEHR